MRREARGARHEARGVRNEVRYLHIKISTVYAKNTHIKLDAAGPSWSKDADAKYEARPPVTKGIQKSSSCRISATALVLSLKSFRRVFGTVAGITIHESSYGTASANAQTDRRLKAVRFTHSAFTPASTRGVVGIGMREWWCYDRCVSVSSPSPPRLTFQGVVDLNRHPHITAEPV